MLHVWWDADSDGGVNLCHLEALLIVEIVSEICAAGLKMSVKLRWFVVWSLVHSSLQVGLVVVHGKLTGLVC